MPDARGVWTRPKMRDHDSLLGVMRTGPDRFGVGIESGLHGVEQGGIDDCSMEPLVDLVLVRSATWAPGQGHSLDARGNLEAKLSMTASMSLMNTERSLT